MADYLDEGLEGVEGAGGGAGGDFDSIWRDLKGVGLVVFDLVIEADAQFFGGLGHGR